MLRLSDTDRDRKGIYPYMTYEEARKYIEYTDTLGSVLGLDSIKELLRRLGDPQNKVKVVHIAGTNGKGSICAFERQHKNRVCAFEKGERPAFEGRTIHITDDIHLS